MPQRLRRSDRQISIQRVKWGLQLLEPGGVIEPKEAIHLFAVRPSLWSSLATLETKSTYRLNRLHPTAHRFRREWADGAGRQEKSTMREAIIRIRNDGETLLDDAGERFKTAWRTGEPTAAAFTFSSPAQLFSVISPKRWQLIERLQHTGKITIRGLARSLERDVRRVHDDVSAMIEWGLVERNDDGLVHVPYDVIHAEFDLRAVA
jgi:predicted transcriptional regulator